MPANLSPAYKKAEQEYRAARDDRERLACLKEMLRTIPKHKGTEHLQADIKTRIKQLTEEQSGGKKGAARSGPVHVVRPEGAAQVALIGPPNSGKSTLHAALTGSRAAAGPFPYSTQAPQPGMCPYEDVQLQLVDLPSISEEFFEPWLVNALEPADAALLVIDIGDPACVEQLETVVRQLETKKISLTNVFSRVERERLRAERAEREDEPDPFRIELPTLLVANKIDAHYEPADIEVLRELTGVRFDTLAVSAKTGEDLERIPAFLFNALEIVRVYTKTPGKPVDRDKPFTLRAGDTVVDVARLVHRDLAGSLRYARAWGTEVYDGQQVGPDHPVADGDVVELHMN